MDSLVVATFAVVALLEIAVPLTLGYWIVRRFGVPWRVFGLGALFFIVVQVIHTPLVLATQVPLSRALLPLGTAAPLVGLALYLGLLAGSSRRSAVTSSTATTSGGGIYPSPGRSASSSGPGGAVSRASSSHSSSSQA